MQKERDITHLMHLGDIFKRVDFMDFGLELARLEQTEQLIGVEFKFFASLNISEKGWTGNLNAFGRKFAIENASVSSIRVIVWGRMPYGRGRGGTGPLALPNQTIVPLRLTASKLPSQVSLPTES